MDLKESVKRGTLSGLRVLWELAKAIVPAMVAVHLLEKTGAISYLTDWLGPVMSIFGLSGESALVLVSGNLVSVYSGLATIVALDPPLKQVTILSAMMMVNHAAISETALIARAGARAGTVLLARTAAMVVVGLLLNWTLP